MYSASRLVTTVCATITLTLAPLGVGRSAPTDAPTAACTTPPPSKGKSRQLFQAGPLMTVALELESQEQSTFHLKYDKPVAECVLESFSSGDAQAAVDYNPWVKGMSTLVYRVAVKRPTGTSEILLLYSGMAALMGDGKPVFHVSEERDGVISWYAMYRDEPAYPAVRELLEQIVSGQSKPLLAVRWPPGAAEAEVVSYDDKRLIK